MSVRNLPADGTSPSYTSAFEGTVALIVDPTPASSSAFWMFCKAGRVTFRNEPLYDERNGSFPTATYLHMKKSRSTVKLVVNLNKAEVY